MEILHSNESLTKSKFLAWIDNNKESQTLLVKSNLRLLSSSSKAPILHSKLYNIHNINKERVSNMNNLLAI